MVKPNPALSVRRELIPSVGINSDAWDEKMSSSFIFSNMKNLILISALIELLAGIVLFFTPQLILDLAQGSGSHLAMGRLYGTAALGLGIFALQVWRNFENETLVKAYLPSFLIFQSF